MFLDYIGHGSPGFSPLTASRNVFLTSNENMSLAFKSIFYVITCVVLFSFTHFFCLEKQKIVKDISMVHVHN